MRQFHSSPHTPCAGMSAHGVCRLLTALVLLLVITPLRAATVEYLTGEKLECRVLSRDDKEMKVEITKDGKTIQRTIPLTEVHVVTINTKRYVINPKNTAKSKNAKSKSKSPPLPLGEGRGEGSAESGDTRTKAEIDAFIDEQGRTPPDWFETTPLDYPKSLDLSFPKKAPEGWNNQKNVGQYNWDLINPNIVNLTSKAGSAMAGTEYMIVYVSPGLVAADIAITNLRKGVSAQLGRRWYARVEHQGGSSSWTYELIAILGV